ncbi:unnamed protein product [Prorocentrum cordatum]|uniref:Uncharacterized protein n=1 Tax=Prorocentrum cordatum TaxID=2364126 RepID=A0ABN9V6K8_9DINO|nr:unnamed protein product [Polarella glacialis]
MKPWRRRAGCSRGPTGLRRKNVDLDLRALVEAGGHGAGKVIQRATLQALEVGGPREVSTEGEPAPQGGGSGVRINGAKGAVGLLALKRVFGREPQKRPARACAVASGESPAAQGQRVRRLSVQALARAPCGRGDAMPADRWHIHRALAGLMSDSFWGCGAPFVDLATLAADDLRIPFKGATIVRQEPFALPEFRAARCGGRPGPRVIIDWWRRNFLENSLREVFCECAVSQRGRSWLRADELLEHGVSHEVPSLVGGAVRRMASPDGRGQACAPGVVGADDRPRTPRLGAGPEGDPLAGPAALTSAGGWDSADAAAPLRHAEHGVPRELLALVKGSIKRRHLAAAPPALGLLLSADGPGSGAPASPAPELSSMAAGAVPSTRRLGAERPALEGCGRAAVSATATFSSHDSGKRVQSSEAFESTSPVVLMCRTVPVSVSQPERVRLVLDALSRSCVCQPVGAFAILFAIVSFSLRVLFQDAEGATECVAHSSTEMAATNPVEELYRRPQP